jgi:hypothetical protein
VIPLQHIVEPVALLLTWQPAIDSAGSRLRRVVARIDRCDGLESAAFKYLTDTDEFREATEAGFQGFPPVHLGSEVVTVGVLDALLRRLPPRNRGDFARYLAQHRLPSPFPYSDFALLGYTGARLPSDGFGLVPIFPADLAGPLDLAIEVAGVRHTFKGAITALEPGDEVHFVLDTKNPVDLDAVQVLWRGQPLGHVNRHLRHQFAHWLRERSVTGSVDRINGTSARPFVQVRAEVR